MLNKRTHFWNLFHIGREATQFIKANYKSLLIQLGILFGVLLLVVLGGPLFLPYLMFIHPSTEEKLFIEVSFDAFVSYLIPGILIFGILISYGYMALIRPTILQRKVTRKNFEEYIEKTTHLFGMHSVYLLGLLFGFTLIGQVILQDSYQHEAAKFLEDYTQIIEGTLEPKQVVFYETDQPLSESGEFKIQPQRGVTYLRFEGRESLYRNCFRCKTSWYKNQDLEGAYSYWVTYAPYSEVILDMEPVRVERSREQMADEVYGYANLTDTQKKFFDIMYDDGLLDIYSQYAQKAEESGSYYRVPVYLDDELTEEQFRPVANLYKTCKFEYLFLPYQYTQYAGHNDSLLLCGEDNQIYINGMFSYSVAIDSYEYTEIYDKEIERVAGNITKQDDDLAMTKAIVQYLLDHTSPCYDEVLEEEQEEDSDSIEEIEKLQDKLLHGDEMTQEEESEFEQRKADAIEVMQRESGYGVLHEGYGTASGYTQAFIALAKRFGLTVIPARDEDRGFSIAMLQINGSWYYLDIHALDYTKDSKYYLFTKEDINKIYGNAEDVKLTYGYTGWDLPETAGEAIAETFVFRDSPNTDEEAVAQYYETLKQVPYQGICNSELYDRQQSGIHSGEAKKIPYSTQGIPMTGDEKEAITAWTEFVFERVQTFDSEERTSLMFRYGNDCNKLGEELMKYLALTTTKNISWENEDPNAEYVGQLDGFSNVLRGRSGTNYVKRVADIQTNYRLLTGRNDTLSLNGMYETPDATKVYAEDETGTVVLEERSRDFVNRGGNSLSGNLALSLYQYPMLAKVEQIEETETGYEVVFFTRYTGIGEHYFNMRLERMPDGSMRILEIAKRYMD